VDTLFGVSFLFVYSSFWISSIGLGGGVVAMVHPIQAPIARTATNVMSTGVEMSQILIDSRSGRRKAIVYEIADPLIIQNKNRHKKST